MKRERSAFPGRERRVWKIKPFERVKESKKLISRDDKETDGEESEGRILAIDLGEKRTGIAMSDPLRIIAGGLKTVETINLLQEIKNLSNQFPAVVAQKLAGFCKKRATRGFPTSRLGAELGIP